MINATKKSKGKKRLLIYAHSYLRYLFVEKVHFFGLEDGKIGIRDGSK